MFSSFPIDLQNDLQIIFFTLDFTLQTCTLHQETLRVFIMLSCIFLTHVMYFSLFKLQYNENKFKLLANRLAGCDFINLNLAIEIGITSKKK